MECRPDWARCAKGKAPAPEACLQGTLRMRALKPDKAGGPRSGGVNYFFGGYIVNISPMFFFNPSAKSWVNALDLR